MFAAPNPRVLPYLSFNSIVLGPGGNVRLTIQSARAGTLQLEFSDDLRSWKLQQTIAINAGANEVKGIPASFAARYYRAILPGQ